MKKQQPPSEAAPPEQRLLLVSLTNLSFQSDLGQRGRLLLLPPLTKASDRRVVEVGGGRWGVAPPVPAPHHQLLLQ